MGLQGLVGNAEQVRDNPGMREDGVRGVHDPLLQFRAGAGHGDQGLFGAGVGQREIQCAQNRNTENIGPVQGWIVVVCGDGIQTVRGVVFQVTDRQLRGLPRADDADRPSVTAELNQDGTHGVAREQRDDQGQRPVQDHTGNAGGEGLHGERGRQLNGDKLDGAGHVQPEFGLRRAAITGVQTLVGAPEQPDASPDEQAVQFDALHAQKGEHGQADQVGGDQGDQVTRDQPGGLRHAGKRAGPAAFRLTDRVRGGSQDAHVTYPLRSLGA